MIYAGHTSLAAYSTPELFHSNQIHLCLVNHIDPAHVPSALFHNDTAQQRNLNAHPLDYYQTIKKLSVFIISTVGLWMTEIILYILGSSLLKRNGMEHISAVNLMTINSLAAKK